MTLTNEQFAAEVGIDHTSASRLRNGNRLPSASLLVRIHERFQVSWERLMTAYAEGPVALSELLGTLRSRAAA